MTVKNVHIKPRRVVKRRTKVSKSGGDTVSWSGTGVQDWVVVFENDSPFNDHLFYPGSYQSGALDGDVEVGEIYKYTVYYKDGRRIDPEIEIE